MATQVIGRSVKAPPGWKWEDGILCPSEEYNETVFNALYEWAKKKKYGLVPERNMQFRMRVPSGSAIYVNVYFKVYQDSWSETEKYLGDGTWQVRALGRKHSLGSPEVYAGGQFHWNTCIYCAAGGLKTTLLGINGQRERYCPFCCVECETEGCGGAIPNGMVSDDEHGHKCNKCFPRVRCRWCQVYIPEADSEKTDMGHTCCKRCADTRRCAECNVPSTRDLTIYNKRKLCKGCFAEVFDKEREPHEKFSDDELPIGGTMEIAQLPNRPVRVISIETEVDGDSHILANTLYNCGIVREAVVEAYGTGVPEQSHWAAFLKYDGSVTGGELINYLMQLDKKEHADSLLNVLAKLRSLHKVGKVQYNSNCGGHIHIDAHNFSTDNVWRLMTGYNYLEDVIYRLAGAGHKYGHRTLDPKHDRANNGHGYALNTAKGPWGVKSGVFQAVRYQDRMTGLNFQPYLRAVQHCRCKAGADNLRSCKCVLPKCTIEWRVWNTQANPRILHGWLSFMQALHAWADVAKEMTDTEEAEYPPFAWVKQPWKDTTAAHKREVYDRIKWIFSNLVFTEQEKDSLLYAFSQTDIPMKEDFVAELRAMESPKHRNVKAPRYCSVRTKDIVIKPPKSKASGAKTHYEIRELRMRAARMGVA